MDKYVFVWCSHGYTVTGGVCVGLCLCRICSVEDSMFSVLGGVCV